MSSVLHRLSARRLAGGAAIFTIALVATTTLSSAPVGAAGSGSGSCTSGPILDLANPSAGDLLSPGDYTVSGVARDLSASSGDGIDRVDLFIGNRDLGGTEVGSAVPQQGLFEVTVKLPTSTTGGTNFFAYAHSSVSGQEAAVSVPVFLGVSPTPVPHTSNFPQPTAVLPPVSQIACAPGNSSSMSSSPAAAPAPATAGSSVAPATTAAMSVSAAPVLTLANPSAGDTLALGDVFISGEAYVPNSPQGAGVDRVDLFLGDRDSGGIHLGTAVPGQGAGLNATPGSLLATGGFSVKVTVPSGIQGGTNFVAYARNSVTGQETVVSVPVNVGVPPTPTPRPSTNS